MINIFKKHPNSVGETYFQHFVKAFSFSFRLIKLAFQAFIHALFPWCFEHSVSDEIKKLNNMLQNRRDSVK